MKKNIRILKDKFDNISWGYFKEFQNKMHARERISTIVVNRYEDTICFMVDTDTCMMEVVIPRTAWVMPMGYEVDKDLLIAYVEYRLGQPIDTNAERFGTYKENSLQVHFELQKPMIAKKVRK